MASESEPKPLDQAHVARIIKHMNADHQEDLSWYLQHYNNVPEKTAKEAILDDLSLAGMTISTGENSRPHFVSFDPPLHNLGDVRGRLVEMTNVSLAALRLARVEVKNFPGLTPVGYFFSLLVVYGTAVFYNPFPFTAPGTITRKILLENSWAIGLLEKWHWWALGGMVGIHVVETAMLVEKLSRYRVKTGSLTWWKYVGSCLVIGFDAHRVLKKEVEVEMERSVKRK